MLAVQERADVLVDDDIYPEPVTSIEQVYRLLQEGEDSLANGRTLTKEQVLRNMDIALNS